jgi:hypothetical protein
MAEFITVYANDKGIIDCPFCKEKHTHGIKSGDGHRLVHCDKDRLFFFTPFDEDGKIHNRKEGYIVKFPKIV